MPAAEVIRDIPYLGDARDEAMDIYLPAEGGEGRLHPAMLVIHGGGFCGGDKADPREQSICADLADEGYICASINYALATREDRWLAFPQNLRDAKSAVAHLRQQASQYGLDENRIGVIGGSAGGTLSLWLALTAERVDLRPHGVAADTSVAVQAAINMYGPTDFGLPLPFTTPARLVAEASPVHQVRAGVPPTLTVQGTDDKLVSPEHAHLLHEALERVGARHQVVMVPGGRHGMDLQPPQADLRPTVLAFLKEALR